jgi:protein-S-isoprenylcysteine O-methyltransferase Ste14
MLSERAVLALKTVLFLMVAPGTVLVYVPWGLLNRGEGASAPRFLLLRAVAPLLWLPGVAMLLWSMRQFVVEGKGTPAPAEPPRELVVHGLYRYVRNPMYVGVISVLKGHFLWFQTGRHLLYLWALFLLFNSFIVLYEEPALKRKFGEPYERYMQEVPRWFPRPPW